MKQKRVVLSLVVVGVFALLLSSVTAHARAEWGISIYPDWKQLQFTGDPVYLGLFEGPEPYVMVLVAGQKTTARSAYDLPHKKILNQMQRLVPGAKIEKTKKTTLGGVPAIHIETRQTVEGVRMTSIGYYLIYKDDLYIVVGTFPRKFLGSRRKEVERVLSTVRVES